MRLIFLVRKLFDKYPFLQNWALKSPARINIDSLSIGTGDFKGLENIKILSAFPIIEGYKDYMAGGYRFDFSDPVGFHSADLTVSYTPSSSIPNDEKFHSRLNYQYMQWKFSLKYNSTDFYDFFGPTKTSRKGYSAGIRYKDYLFV